VTPFPHRSNQTHIYLPTYAIHAQHTPPGTAAQQPRGDEPASLPGYFRFLTLLCLWVAIEEGADALILEVGVGGRHDATNVIPPPLACAVTRLDLEHTETLGDTVGKIAWEKGGIMKKRGRGGAAAAAADDDDDDDDDGGGGGGGGGGGVCFVGEQAEELAREAMPVLEGAVRLMELVCGLVL
jgi:hypothetical protein